MASFCILQHSLFPEVDLLFSWRCRVCASSVLIIIEVRPVSMHRASLDVVRNALAVSMFIILCILMYFRLLYSCFMASIQTGAPSRSGRMAPLLIVSIASCLIPHITLAAQDIPWISLAHLSVKFLMIKVNV